MERLLSPHSTPLGLRPTPRRFNTGICGIRIAEGRSYRGTRSSASQLPLAERLTGLKYDHGTLVALNRLRRAGHPGSDHYAGLETFANPGASHVKMRSDELAAVCPVTGQPDLYTATIE